MRTLKSRKGQGTTEYILVVGIAVAIAVGILWNKMKQPLEGKVGEIVTGIQKVK